VSLTLAPGAREEAVIAAVDRVLAPYGGLGAYGRDEQVSHRFLTNEITELKTIAAALPAIFLGVAAFLVSLVMSRLVATQRQQIGMLKAVGYSSAEIGLHYAELVVIVAAAGACLGAIGGAAMGQGLARTYADFFRLPVLVFEGDAAVVAIGAALAVGGALAGALAAVRRAVRLPPAEAMRPAAPPSYRRAAIERLGPVRPSRRRRAWCCATWRAARCARSSPRWASRSRSGSVVARFASDAIDPMFTRVMGEAQRQDATVTFTHALTDAAATGRARCRGPPRRAVPGGAGDAAQRPPSPPHPPSASTSTRR
jgi:putative ABC transport system permease protein